MMLQSNGMLSNFKKEINIYNIHIYITLYLCSNKRQTPKKGSKTLETICDILNGIINILLCLPSLPIFKGIANYSNRIFVRAIDVQLCASDFCFLSSRPLKQ